MAMGRLSGVEGRADPPADPAQPPQTLTSHAPAPASTHNRRRGLLRNLGREPVPAPVRPPVLPEGISSIAPLAPNDSADHSPIAGRSNSRSPGSSRMSSTTPPYPMETNSHDLSDPEVLFGPIPTDELNQLTLEIGSRDHQHYQQQQLFQRSFQRLVTEMERVYKHQLFNLLQEMGLTSLLFGGGMTGSSKWLGCDEAARQKLVLLQQYTKKKCDALVAALRHHDNVFGTLLKNSLLPFLVTSKCFEDGVINRLCALSGKPDAESALSGALNTRQRSPFDQSGASTPGLASDWSLSGGSSPGCSSPTPKPGEEANGLPSGLSGPPPAKRAKLSVNHSVNHTGMTNSLSKAVEFLRTEGLAMQPTIKAEPAFRPTGEPSAFRYLKGGQRSALFASKQKLPDNTPLGHATFGGQVRTGMELHVQNYGMLSGALQQHPPLQHHQLLHHPVSQLAQHQFQPVPNLPQYNSVMLPTQDAYDPMAMDPHVSRSSMSMSAELMAATTSLENQNAWNQQARSTAAGRKRKKRFKGIRKTASGKWVSRIEHNGKQKHLGTFATLEEAATAYDEALYQILSRIRTKKINLKRFNFPDKIRVQYGLGQNGSLGRGLRVKREMPTPLGPAQTITFKQEQIGHAATVAAYNPSLTIPFPNSATPILHPCGHVYLHVAQAI